MLRIRETSEDGKTVTLRLDGKLIDTWVSDLEELCLHHRDEKSKTVVLDFSGVTFINNKGVRMLENIKHEKIKITNCSLFVHAVLSKLKIDGKE